ARAGMRTCHEGSRGDRVHAGSGDLEGLRESQSTATRATVGASERRPLTVLFADIAGSTAIAERMDPEDWTAIVSQAFARMNATVTRYDGTVARLMGDGVL